MRKASNTYAIFWEPPKLQTGAPAYVDPGYNAGILRYFKDVGGTGLYNNNTQYYQTVSGNQQHIKNVSGRGHPCPAGERMERQPDERLLRVHRQG